MKTSNETRAGMLPRAIACAALALASVGAVHAQGVGYPRPNMSMSFLTIAGGFVGDSTPKGAYLQTPNDVVFDSAGNMYVSQAWSNRVIKIRPDGYVVRIAGGTLNFQGNTGFGGDGGPAGQSKINRPGGMAIDATGNVYFSDMGNHRIRRIATDGTISTFAGNGTWASSGDGGQATMAGIGEPSGLAIDKNGNLFLADRINHRIRKITPAGVISTYAGTGTAGSTGNNGPATSAQLNSPLGIDVDATGNLYIADTMNQAVRRVATNGTISQFMTASYPVNVEVDTAGNVYATSDCSIIKRKTDTTLVTYGAPGVPYCTKSPDGTQASVAGFGYPDGIAIDAAGNVFFADGDYSRIAKIDATDNRIYTYAGLVPTYGHGTLATQVITGYIDALTVADDRSVFFYDYLYAFRVRKLSALRVWNYAGTGEYFDSTCAGGTALSCGLARVTGMASGPGGVTYIADRNLAKVIRVNADGTITDIAGGGSGTAENVPATSIRIYPRGIALDDAGNLFIADDTSHRIRKVNKAGIVSTFAGTGAIGPLGDNGPATSATVENPKFVATDGAGNVFIAEASGRIRKVGLDGIIRPVAGKVVDADPTTLGYYSGEGGLAIDATTGVVHGLAAHPSGVYFTSEGKLRRVRPDGRIETVRSLWYHAVGVTVKFNELYLSTQDGRVLRARLPHFPPNDHQGDTRSDVFWRGSNGANARWGDAIAHHPVTALATENKLVAQGMFDDDNATDLVWRNTLNGNVFIWRGANPNFQIILAAVPDQKWAIVGAGDFNADGKSDLLWRNKSTGANEVWLTGNSKAKLFVATLTDARWVVAGIGDFDADGKSDILWRNTETGSNTIWSAANANVRKPINGVTNTNWKVVAIGDFNGDGVSDIAWRDVVTGANVIWKAGNYATQMPLPSVTNMAWTIAAAGDYEGDGADDLFWRNSVGGTNTIWRNANAGDQKAIAALGSSWKVAPFEAQP